MDLCGVTVCPPRVTLQLGGPPAAARRQVLTYTLDGGNGSPVKPATKATPTDTLPANLTYVNGSANPPPASAQRRHNLLEPEDSGRHPTQDGDIFGHGRLGIGKWGSGEELCLLDLRKQHRKETAAGLGLLPEPAFRGTWL